MKNKGIGIQVVFLLFLIMVLMMGCVVLKKVIEVSGSVKKIVDIDISGDLVKVGIFYLLSGIMVISEVFVYDVELMVI